MLRITPSGEALVCSLLPTISARTRAIFGEMPEAARRALLEQLRGLSAQIERHEPAR
jgi:hypothetical protein